MHVNGRLRLKMHVNGRLRLKMQVIQSQVIILLNMQVISSGV